MACISVDRKLNTVTVELSSTSQNEHPNPLLLKASGVHRMGVCLEPVSILQDLEIFPTSLADPDSWKTGSRILELSPEASPIFSLQVSLDILRIFELPKYLKQS